ncbi:MAG TPA: hypothetical protein VFW71_05205 [Actinomycetota bacterium]|nr:hypothetical protein [Actinomycetota bacterium]
MPETPVVFLVTDTDVLMQEEATKLWRSVGSPGVPDRAGAGDVISLAATQLRGLRRDQARRVHPAGSAHRSADRATDGLRLEIYNPLTSTWAAVPPAAGRARVGDALCSRLPDGRVLIAQAGRASSGPCAVYDPTTGQWSTAPGREPAGPRRRGSAGPSVIAVRRSE